MNLEDHWREEVRRQNELSFQKGGRDESGSSSLVEFLTARPPQIHRQSRCAELGVGNHSLLASAEFVDGVDLYDWSTEALSQLEKREGDVFYERDLTREKLPQNQYELILDDHFLHTIPKTTGLRPFVLSSIREGLTSDGAFYFEHMVLPSNLSAFSVDDLYRYEHGDIWKCEFDRPDLPVRHIPSALDLENELLEAGFRLVYFRVENHLKVIPVAGRSQAFESDPVLVRIIAKRREKSGSK